MVQFGWGSKQCCIQVVEIDMISVVVEFIVQDKDLMKILLYVVGVLVLLGWLVCSVEEVWEVVQEIYGLVVVKLCDGNQGKGVVVCICMCEEVMMVYEVVVDILLDVIVECYIFGYDYCLFVVGKYLVVVVCCDLL